ncbi:MAG: OmpA family protein [Planctomycetota bacterium]|nr:OmpA family protein [Planctomycetota bacterium]
MNGKLHMRIALVGALILPLISSCVTSRTHQHVVEEKDEMIQDLRDEREGLKKQVAGMRTSLDSAHGELANASAQMSEPAPTIIATPETKEKIPELDNVGVTYGMRDGNMVITIPSAITFKSGEATLSKDGEKALRQVASTLKSKYGEAKYSIEGHTDADPIKKSKFASNRELSIARARAVHTFLVVECAVLDEKCVVVGHGEYKPIATNATDKDKAKNRRVEIVVHKN